MATLEHLGTNRGFELGNTTQWTIAESYGENTQSVTAAALRTGSYGLAMRSYFQKTEEPHTNSSWSTAESGYIPVFAGKNYLYSVWAKQYAYSAVGGTNTRIFRLYVNFYDSGFTLVGSQIQLTSIATVTTTDWTYQEQLYATPAGASYVKYKLYVGILGFATGSTGNYGVYIDDCSITSVAPAKVGSVYLSDYGVM